MYLSKIFIIIIMLTTFSFSIYSQDKSKNMNNFFKKVQEKKIVKLKNKLSGLNKTDRDKIIKIIKKYDKKIYKIRKSVMKHRPKNDLECNKKLVNIERHLKMRKEIIELQLQKIKELKTTDIDNKIIEKTLIFERRFMQKLRKLMRKKHHRGQ